MLSHRAGESSQIIALAEALGWPYERKVMHYRWSAGTMGLLRRRGIGGITAQSRRALREPWPDLVITSGLRNEPVARWLAARSGGRTRLVFIGRTWCPIDHFDLLVTTPQYRVRPGPRVLENTTTLQSVTADKLAAALNEWGDYLDGLPRPHIAVIVGGNSGPYTLGANGGRRLAARVSEYAARRGGSLLVTTSSRTSHASVEQIAANLSGPHRLFRWRKNAPNPYFAFLASADEIIVTGDSIAMLSEACATAKPVFVYDIGRHTLAMRHPIGEPESWQDWFRQDDFRLVGFTYWLTMKFGPRRLSRELRVVFDRIMAAGKVAWFGDPPPAVAADVPDDVKRTVSRVADLMKASQSD